MNYFPRVAAGICRSPLGATRTGNRSKVLMLVWLLAGIASFSCPMGIAQSPQWRVESCALLGSPEAGTGPAGIDANSDAVSSGFQNPNKPDKTRTVTLQAETSPSSGVAGVTTVVVISWPTGSAPFDHS
jgi:hypothetical protein